MKDSKKREEVEFLKKNWEQDPCWDIELTEGFEEFEEELFLFREKKEKEWEIKLERKKEEDRDNNYKTFNRKFVESFGYSDRFLMAQVFKSLTDRIDYLEKRIKDLEGE